MCIRDRQCNAQHGNIEVCSQQEAQQEIRSNLGADEDIAQPSKAQCRQNAGGHGNAADDESRDDGKEALHGVAAAVEADGDDQRHADIVGKEADHVHGIHAGGVAFSRRCV